MKDIPNLQLFDLEIADSKVRSTDDASESSKLLVREQKATFLIRDLGMTELFCQVLEYLPTYLRDKVSSIYSNNSEPPKGELVWICPFLLDFKNLWELCFNHTVNNLVNERSIFP